MSLKLPEKYRLTDTSVPYLDEKGGAFRIPRKGQHIFCIASIDAGLWEHVSVTVAYPGRQPKRCPIWDEMCFVKDLFWDEEDEVIQFYPKKSNYANLHPFCLHLWRPVDDCLKLPKL